LPLIVTPHPLNDLTPDQVRELAQAVYPLIIKQLTNSGPIEQNVYAEFVHPASRGKRAKAEVGGNAGRSA
jgi:hypothetical protein